ncbi:hypothetical protein ABW20_dc0107660 [Dactylellina cionopaga]|nr:hypothetical protein ABW20_dc0107660 [Dactylellina cionopaga]
MASDRSDGEGAINEGQSHGETSTQGGTRPKQPNSHPTQFLCLPLHGQHYTTLPPPYPSFKTAIRQFAIDEAPSAASSESFAIPPGAIRPFNTLHLTLGVMANHTPEQLERAKSTLESLDLAQFFPDNAANSLYIDLKGLESMGRESTKTTVLVIPPTDPTNRLTPFAESLRDHFIKEGIITPENRPLRLHATIVNTVYSKPPRPPKVKRGQKASGWKKARVTFDAAELLERYQDHVWAENLEVDRVEICWMGAKDGEEVVLEDGTVDEVGGGYTVAATRLISP